MGRPLNKRYLGKFEGPEKTGIRVWACDYDGTMSICYITAQKGSSAYDVVDSNDKIFRVKLVDKKFNDMSLQPGEGVVKGVLSDEIEYVDDEIENVSEPAYDAAISIARVYNRTCRDFEGNRYKWQLAELENRDTLVLFEM